MHIWIIYKLISRLTRLRIFFINTIPKPVINLAQRAGFFVVIGVFTRIAGFAWVGRTAGYYGFPRVGIRWILRRCRWDRPWQPRTSAAVVAQAVFNFGYYFCFIKPAFF